MTMVDVFVGLFYLVGFLTVMCAVAYGGDIIINEIEQRRKRELGLELDEADRRAAEANRRRLEGPIAVRFNERRR